MCCCFNYLFNCIELELNACCELKVLKIINIIMIHVGGYNEYTEGCSHTSEEYHEYIEGTS